MKKELEALIDKTSVAAVCDALSEICAEKAEHVLTNWQDDVTASHWAKAAKLLTSVFNKVTV